MDNLFLFISIVSIIALIVGMIKPDFVLKFLEKEKRNRKYVSLVFGISLLVSFILFGMTVDTTEDEEIAPNQIEEVEADEEEEEVVLLTLSDEEKELLEENYSELSSGQIRNKVDKILKNIDDYEDADQEFILQHKDRIEEEQVAFKEKERKEKEEEKKEAEKKRKEKEEAEKAQREKEEAERKKKEEAEKAQREKEEKEKYNTGITRNDMARDKDGLMGEYVKFSGKVVQVMQGDGYNQYRFAVNDDYDQMILIEIANDLIDSNILEDDYITIEGMSSGNHNYTTVLGAEQTIPAVIVDNVYLD
ncbi:hypothetical protein ACEN4K_11620 [Marinilactibacillus psychrotolerans]|uniref:TolA protein n=1 Tax=Marinilactibacillus psychrotolerans 42ea TaxID=1255609 RepID=A0A1R4IME7_9LACT|nr:hypothetical protein [Marinilactibacillus psychrotolerans]GEQ34336.1 hypothetical protein B795N_22180 [Marinilactibacillus psychrotolerans]SJN20948.1 hypothetical protein FM115_01730 [Marinilactibacillus psychrotolerans 42ea]